MVTNTTRNHSLTGTPGIGVTLHIVHSGEAELEKLCVIDAVKFIIEHFGVETVTDMTIAQIMECYLDL